MVMLSHSGDTIVGGVRKVAFVRTELIDSIVFDEVENVFSEIRLKSDAKWKIILPKENMARFDQTITEDTGVWLMTLKVSLLCNEAGRTVALSLKNDIREGVVILVEFNDGSAILMGYSSRSKSRVGVKLDKAEILTATTEQKCLSVESISLSWRDILPAKKVNVIL